MLKNLFICEECKRPLAEAHIFPLQEFLYHTLCVNCHIRLSVEENSDMVNDFLDNINTDKKLDKAFNELVYGA